MIKVFWFNNFLHWKNIQIKTNKINKPLPFSYWIDPKKLKKYTLPTFTKKIVSYLENQS